MAHGLHVMAYPIFNLSYVFPIAVHEAGFAKLDSAPCPLCVGLAGGVADNSCTLYAS